MCRPDSNRVKWVHEVGVTTEQGGNTGEAEASSSPASRIHGGFMDEDNERRDRDGEKGGAVCEDGAGGSTSVTQPTDGGLVWFRPGWMDPDGA